VDGGSDALGNDIFIQGNQSVTFAPGGTTETVTGVIADEAGAQAQPLANRPGNGTGNGSGAGSVAVPGAGTVIFSADNACTGTTTLSDDATLQLSQTDGAGTGRIDVTGNSTLRVPGHIGNTITGFNATLDDSGLTFLPAARLRSRTRPTR